MRTRNLFCCSLLLLLCLGHYGQSQCLPEVTAHSRNATTGQHEILIASVSSPARCTFELYDLYQGKVVDTNITSIYSSDGEVVFRNVPTGRYTIYVSSEGCSEKRTLGGIQGISVGNE